MNATQSHATALRLAKKHGVRIEFTRTVVEKDAMGAATGNETVTSVIVHCIDNYEHGSAAEVARQELGERESPALFGVPDVLGQEPDPGMSCVWAGKSHTVKTVKPFRPTGQTVTMVIVLDK